MKVYFWRDERWPDYSIADSEKWSAVHMEMSQEELDHFITIAKEYDRLQHIIDEAYENSTRK